MRFVNRHVLSALTMGALMLGTSGVAFAKLSPLQKQLDIPASLDPNNAEDKKLINFVQGLVAYQDDRDPNVVYWRSRYRLTPRFSGSIFENPDATDLEKGVRTYNKKLTALAQAAFDKTLDLDGAIGNATHPRPATDDAAEAPTAPTADTRATSDSIRVWEAIFGTNGTTGLLTQQQYNGWRSGVLLEFLSAGYPTGASASFADMQRLVTQSKSNAAGQFAVRLKAGFTDEQLALWARYRQLVPAYRWYKFDSAGGVTATYSGISEAQLVAADGSSHLAGPRASDLVGADIFSGGGIQQLPMGDTTLTFRMSAAGMRALVQKRGAGAPWALPVKFTQTVEMPYQVRYRITCDANAVLNGKVGVRVRKYNNTDVFVPEVTSLPEVIDQTDKARACKYEGDPRDLNAGDYQALAAAEQSFWEEFGAKKDAAQDMRDEMMRQLLSGAQGTFENYMPEKWYSRIVPVMTTECRSHIVRTCGFSIFGACIIGASASARSCDNVTHLIRQYYSVKIPMYQVYESTVKRQIDVHRFYEVAADRNVSVTAKLDDNLCVKFQADEGEPVISCDQDQIAQSQTTTRSEPPAEPADPVAPN